MVTYHNGDLLESNCKVICHQTNCRGVMGAGIAKAIREKFPGAHIQLQLRYQLGLAKLGEIDFRPCFDQEIKDDRYIINMYAQENCWSADQSEVFTDYDAFRECCKKIKFELILLFGRKTGTIKIGFPDHIGCGLARGNWDTVKEIIEEEFSGPDWDVEIWKLK